MDEALLLAINQGWAHPMHDTLFQFLSNRGAFGFPLLLLILALLAWRWGRDGVKLWFLVVVCIALGDQIGNLLKHLLQQPRPCVEMYQILRSPTRAPGTPCGGIGSGMPSNHALNFFLLSALLGRLLSSWRITLILGLIACGVGLSRIYLGVHLPSQVLAGTILGLSIGFLAASIAIRYLPWVHHFHQQCRTRSATS